MPAWKCTQNLKTLAPIGAEKSVMEISIGEKEKWTNKETDKQYVAVFFVTQYNSSLSSFVPNFRALSQVVAEKSLTEKKVYRQTDRQTNIITEKAKTIYPLYTSYRGYNQPTSTWDILHTRKCHVSTNANIDRVGSHVVFVWIHCTDVWKHCTDILIEYK